MLATIPPEILTHISLHLSLADLVPPVPLLLASRSIHSTLSPLANPRLYARVFRANFDVSAAQRRLTPTENGNDELNAVALTHELHARARALWRLRRMCERGDVADVQDSDLWAVYIMLIENDGTNIQHLLAPTGFFHLPHFLKLYHEQHLLSAALEPGYPSETVGRALIMWIAWLFSTHRSNTPEPPEDRDERLFVLRPYVFAAQQYDLYFAPWTLVSLPTSLYPPSSGAPSILGHDALPIHPDEPNSPFVADLNPKSREVALQWYGQTIRLSPPMVAHAAILRFFAGPPKDDGDKDDPVSNGNGNGNPMDVDMDDDEPPAPSLISKSEIHDRDFRRLLSCYDPVRCPGMPRRSWLGSWTGCWEGNFSFFDFDAFREMLTGQSRALYEGRFGEQRQVWRLKETYVRPTRGKGKSRHELVNAGFPAGNGRADLSSALAEQNTLRDTIRLQVEAMEGYEIVPDDEIERALEDEGTEMLLTGTGHSAWGRFILKGRVRTWDGMASLVKEYAPDSRGKWFYRGYVLAGDVFVGRWRDTFTPEEYVGYEGTFILNRR